MPAVGERKGAVTPDDHGAIIGIAAWFLMVVLVLAVFVRLGIRFSASHIPGKDDAFAFAAMVSDPHRARPPLALPPLAWRESNPPV